MRIIALIQGQPNGVSYHRLIMPCMLLEGVDVYVTNNLDEKDFEKGCTMLVYNRVLPENLLPRVKDLKEKYGFKICVDIDDYWHLDPHHILYKAYAEDNFSNRQINQIIASDIITVTNDRLAMQASTYNKNVHVLPNAIPKQGQFRIERTPSPFTRLFWQGSDTHRKDTELLAQPAGGFLQVATKVKMIMGGYVENCEQWQSMVFNYTAGLTLQYKLIPAAHVTSYYQAYSEADVCLIPLVKSMFNQYKSCLKVMEAANLGLPCIVSNVHPYKDLPVIYVDKPNDWVKHVKRLVGSKRAQKEEGLKLKEFCEKNFNFQKINEERKQILTNV